MGSGEEPSFVKVDRVRLFLARYARFPIPVESHSERLFLQFLVAYKLNPRTVVFVGYSDNHVGETGFRLTQAARTFFIKLGYAWTL